MSEKELRDRVWEVRREMSDRFVWLKNNHGIENALSDEVEMWVRRLDEALTGKRTMAEWGLTRPSTQSFAKPPQVEIDGLRAEGKARPKLYQRLANVIAELQDIRGTYEVYSDPVSSNIETALDSLGQTLYVTLVDAVKLGK